jgi:MFS superfamily sulfate permease-like transporter
MQNKFFDLAQFKANFSKDFLASIVVFLVAIPLCLGIAIASGLPPTAGVITGIIGGIFVGLISGSPLAVSGPAAGLVVLVVEILAKHGIMMFGEILMLAGILQMLAGYFKLGVWFRAISPAVIHGMLAGIGILIIGSKSHSYTKFNYRKYRWSKWQYQCGFDWFANHCSDCNLGKVCT